MNVSIEGIVSLTAIAIVAYPIIKILQDVRASKVYIVWGLGVLFAVAMSYVLKYSFGNRFWFAKRPDDAVNCSLTNSGGPVGGRPGFPSGHVTQIAAFWTLGYLITKNPVYMYIGLVHVLAMAWSRVALRCHTIEQVAAGAVTGVVSALVWWSLVGSL